MADADTEAAPPIIRCERCGRHCMDLSKHRLLCAEEQPLQFVDISAKSAPDHRTFGACLIQAAAVETGDARIHSTSGDYWDDEPCTAPSLRQQQEEEAVPPLEPPELVPCPSCGRRFTADRLHIHRHACAQGFPGYRATIAALDDADRESAWLEKRLSSERQKTSAATQRALEAEAQVHELQSALSSMSQKYERSEAAARSLSAAYDVVREAGDASQQKVAALQARAEAAEAALAAALTKAERAEAAAKSMEAAYDVVAGALEDEKKRRLQVSE